MRTRRFFLIALFLGGVAIIVLNDLLRRHLAIQNELAAVALGSFPNLIAALTAPALVLAELSRIKRFSHVSSRSMGLASGIISSLLLFSYELSQYVTPNAVLDVNDFLATLAGGLTWALSWRVLDNLLPAA